MRKVTSFIIALLGLFTVASAQLPPKVIADKYLIQAEQLLKKQDYETALNLVEKIIALQKEHNLTLSDEFHFKYAQVAFSTGSFQTALESVSKYLSTETEGEFDNPRNISSHAALKATVRQTPKKQREKCYGLTRFPEHHQG